MIPVELVPKDLSPKRDEYALALADIKRLYS